MNIEAAVSIQGVRGPKMVRGSAAGNVGELEHHVAPEKARRLRVLESRRAEEIALDSARSGAPISPDATERQSAPTELTVAGDRKFESCSLQRRVCELSVPRWGRSPSTRRRGDRAAWRGDPRAFPGMIEAARSGIGLSSRGRGFPS